MATAYERYKKDIPVPEKKKNKIEDYTDFQQAVLQAFREAN